MTNIVQKPSFLKVYKKLRPEEKAIIDNAIQQIINNSQVGELKKGDLSGLSVYKFKMNRQEKLLAYVWSKTQISLVNLGTHENFYRDLKNGSH